MVNAPFFLLAPGWAQLPMTVLATAATVIASQAVITGAYSVASQAAQLGYLPRLRVAHTSESSIGQIYVPWINGFLMVAVLILIFAFRSSAALGYAYGMAVTGTITITTLLFFYIAHKRWHWPLWLVLVGGGALLVVDLMFFAANLTKLMHGAWLPLLIGILAFTVMTTWQKGRAIVTRARDEAEGPLPEFIAEIDGHRPPLPRIPGTAIFLNRGSQTAPLAMRANVEHNHVLHEHVIILSLDTKPVPRVDDADRLSVDDLGDRHDGIFFVAAKFGYMERPNVPHVLRLIDPSTTDGPVDVDSASYFLSKLELCAGDKPTMAAAWRKRLFIATSYITADAALYFQLPLERTVIIGERIEFDPEQRRRLAWGHDGLHHLCDRRRRSRRHGARAAARPGRCRGDRAGEARRLPSRLPRRHSASQHAAAPRRSGAVAEVHGVAAEQGRTGRTGPRRHLTDHGGLPPTAPAASLHRDGAAVGSAGPAGRRGPGGADVRPAVGTRGDRPADRGRPNRRGSLPHPGGRG